MRVIRHHSGIEVSDIVRGYLVSRLYVGYTVAQARAKFKEETR
jgi:hypothetical protein